MRHFADVRQRLSTVANVTESERHLVFEEVAERLQSVRVTSVARRSMLP
jgi:hypothetical protein